MRENSERNRYRKDTEMILHHTMVLKKQRLYERSRMQDYLKEEQIDKFPVAMAYVPWQYFDKMYDDLEKAFNAGTIFPELNKPFTGRRCV